MTSCLVDGATIRTYGRAPLRPQPNWLKVRAELHGLAPCLRAAVVTPNP
jgi:hypothetical protein